MKTCCAHKSHGPRASRGWPARGEMAGGLVSSLALALMPKCPACVAAYVALFTGVGISMRTAAWLRGSMVAACIVTLATLVVLATMRVAGWRTR